MRTGSLSYYKVLSQAGYLVNDTTFPGRFIKKDGQIYLNTWHGTPLKKMGRDNRPEAVSMGNVLRNCWILITCFSKLLHGRDNVTRLYAARSLQRNGSHEGYPRNDIFYSEPGERQRRLLKEEGLEGKKIIMYLPTFRGLVGSVDNGKYMDVLNRHLRIWDEGLHDDEVLLVKLHPFLHGSENFDGYRHIRTFPAQWDTYEGLSLCSTLITDYSVYFMILPTPGKQIILFAYDRREYENGRGMYEDIGEYPFLYTEDAAEVIGCIRRGGESRTLLLWKIRHLGGRPRSREDLPSGISS